MSIDKIRCEEIIKAHKEAGEIITSYDNFDLLYDVMGETYRKIPESTILRALAYGVKVGWLKAEWSGIGTTPYAGAARRQRVWNVKEAIK